MKTKELKNLAKKIAKAEKRLQETTNAEEKANAETEIMSLCGKVTSVSDMLILDDMIQEALEDLS